MSIAEKLLKLKTKVEKAEQQELELTGAIKNDLLRLKDDFNCEDIAQAEKLLDELDSDIQEQEDELEKGIGKLIKQFEIV